MLTRIIKSVTDNNYKELRIMNKNETTTTTTTTINNDDENDDQDCPKGQDAMYNNIYVLCVCNWNELVINVSSPLFPPGSAEWTVIIIIIIIIIISIGSSNGNIVLVIIFISYCLHYY